MNWKKFYSEIKVGDKVKFVKNLMSNSTTWIGNVYTIKK